MGISSSPISPLPRRRPPPFNTGCPWWIKGILGGCDAEVMLQLCPVADDFPGSDLDFIERQLSEPTWEAYTIDLYQIYPSSALMGIAQESFNTTKQFQKLFLKNLDRNRTSCSRITSPCCFNEEGNKVWVDGFGYAGKQKNRGCGKGYRSSIWGTVLGADLPLCDFLRGGVGAGYAFTTIKKFAFDSENSKISTTDVDNYQGTIYLSCDKRPWFVDSGFSIGWNRYHGKRHIDFNEVDRRARAAYNGQEYSGFFTTGYQCCCRGFAITPLATLLYSWVHLDAYREKGAQTLNLRLKSQHYQFLESGLGFKLSSQVDTCWGCLVPEIRAFWLHEYFDRQVDVKASFSGHAALAGYFRQKGLKSDQNMWNVGASITCFQNTRLSLLLDYDFECSSHYFDHQGMVELTYAF